MLAPTGFSALAVVIARAGNSIGGRFALRAALLGTRVAEPAEIAEFVAFLASDAAGFCTARPITQMAAGAWRSEAR